MDNLLQVPTLVLITGAARGIGQSCAVQFTKKLHENLQSAQSRLILLDILNMEETRAKCADISNLPVTCVHQDLSDLKTFENLFKKIEEESGSGYQQAILVNNAGTVRMDLSCDLEPEFVQKFVSINLASMISLTSWFVRTQKAASRDIMVVNVTSRSTRESIKGFSMYGTCKAAREKFLTDLGVEDTDVTCVNYDPSLVGTDLWREMTKNSTYVDPSMKGRMDKFREDGLVVTPEDAAVQMVDGLIQQLYKETGKFIFQYPAELAKRLPPTHTKDQKNA